VFLYENENYVEGWFELAKLKIAEGDINGARQALAEIEKINPNSEELARLKKFL
jgi:cytochrome c-type biogenesis protein CcmH/NrfG